VAYSFAISVVFGLAFGSEMVSSNPEKAPYGPEGGNTVVMLMNASI
jgi:hypothetical protein